MQNINKYIAELRAQREKIDVAIQALSALVGARRGRPPKWMSQRKRAKAATAGE